MGISYTPPMASRYMLNVKDFGAAGDGTTSDVAAFNAAITAANAAAAIVGGNNTTVGGVALYIPPGVYNVEAGLTSVFAKDGIHVWGGGGHASVLRCQDGTVFKFGDGVTQTVGGGVHNLHFRYTSTPGSTSKAIEIDKAAVTFIEGITLYNVRCFVSMGTSAVNGAYSTFIRDVRGSTDPAAGSIVFNIRSGAGLWMSNMNIFANGVGFPADATSAHPANTTTFARLGEWGFDTVVAQGVLSNRYNIGWHLATSGAGIVVGNTWLSNVTSDYNKTNGMLIDTSAGGMVSNLYVSNGYFVGTDGNSLEYNTSAGTAWDHTYTACHFQQGGKNNVRYSGTGGKNIVLRDCLTWGANRLASVNTGNQQDDVVVLGKGISLIGGNYGMSGGDYQGFGGPTRYGINVAGNIGHWRVQDVTVSGGTGDIIINASSSGGFGRLCNGNRRRQTQTEADPAVPTYATFAGVTAPASTVNYVNTDGFVEEIYLYGGTVTVISHNGVQVGTVTPFRMTLQPGDTLNMTYSVVPTMVRRRRP